MVGYSPHSIPHNRATKGGEMSIMDGRTLIREPAGHIPVMGEWYRFVYVFSGGNDWRSTWPGAIWRIVDQSPFWQTDEAHMLFVTDRGVVVVDALLIGGQGDLESLMSGIVELSMSTSIIAQIRRVELVDASKITDVSRADTALAASDVIWTPEPEDEPIPGFFETLGDAFTDALDVGSEAVGGAAGNLLSGTLRPSVIITVGIIAAIFIYSKKGGG